MDVCDITQQCMLMVNIQKEVLRGAKYRRGERPRDRRSKEEAYFHFILYQMFTDDSTMKDVVHTSWTPPAYPPCTTPLADLKRTAIRDLQLETHHRGTYLLLRALTPPTRMTAIMALMEDENDDAVLFHLYQQENEDVRRATDIIQEDTILLVKEPYFKVTGDGEYGVRVDHLSDIIYIHRDDSRVPAEWQPRIIELDPSAETLKMKGNRAMGENRYWDAITEYSTALLQSAITANETEVIKRNRSLAFLKTKQYDAALSDTGFPNFKPKPAEKALFRAAEALYYLGRFSESCEVLELFCANFPQNKQANMVLERARARLQEERTGVYNFKELQAKAKKLRPPHLDHATYIGPVEIRETKSKGRGLFVTKSVKAGDLLLCEKAFSHAFVDTDGDSSAQLTMLLNTETNRSFMGAQADLITLIVQKLHRNPSTAPPLTALYHGTYEGVGTRMVDSEPVVDTFLVDRIISHNCFGAPISTLIHQKEIRSKKIREHSTHHHSCGIWVRASYVNHSCMSNARRSFIGDMMIVRATRDMEPGTEITWWYVIPTGTDPKEMKKTHKQWRFICDCAICLDAKATKATVVTERLRLVESIKRVFNFSELHALRTAKIERLLDSLNKTYTQPADKVPRLLVWDPQLALARAYAARNKMTKSLKSIEKVLIALGFIIHGADSSSSKRFTVVKWGLMVDAVIDTFLDAQHLFEAMAAWEDARRAEGYARTAYKIVIGEDESFNSLV